MLQALASIEPCGISESFVTITVFPPAYIRLTVKGAAGVTQLLRLIDHLHDVSTSWPSRRLLIDLRAVNPVPEPVGQALTGDHVGAELAHLDKIASLAAPESITRNSERAAARQGANLRVFSTERETVDWLGE